MALSQGRGRAPDPVLLIYEIDRNFDLTAPTFPSSLSWCSSDFATQVISRLGTVRLQPVLSRAEGPLEGRRAALRIQRGHLFDCLAAHA